MVDDRTTTNESEDNNPPVDGRIRVCLRLRPTNKLEASRRSKHCAEVDRNGTCLTVDSPLEGEYDFTFDRVFGEDAPQSEVYEHAVSHVASNLLRGYNCTVMAYGQTGSGKTHTMMGVGGGGGGSNGGAGGGGGKRKDGNSQRESSEREKSPEEAGESGDGVDAKDGDDRVGGPEDDRMGKPLEENGNAGSDPNHVGGDVGDGGETDDVATDDESLGMIPRTIHSIFALMEKSDPNVEYTVRCSYVEIYLEKILDLLNPGGRGSVTLSVVDDATADEAAGVGAPPQPPPGGNGTANHANGGVAGGGVRIEGASEACCFDESDVLALLARGNACRTVSSTKMNTDSSRSHAIFVMRIEQRDVESGTTKSSVVHMVDLAGSELAGQKSRGSAVMPKKQGAKKGMAGSAVQAEAKMINKSLSALGNVVRSLAEKQRPRDSSGGGGVGTSGGGPRRSSAAANVMPSYRHSKLTRVLRPAFGGNCLTTVILTASPSSYNIGETINSIRFGQRCRRLRNTPVVNSEKSPSAYRRRLAESERKQVELMSFVKALAAECRSLKTDGMRGQLGKGSHSGPLWDSIDTILEENESGAETTVNDVTSLWMGNKRKDQAMVGDGDGAAPDGDAADDGTEASSLRQELNKTQSQLAELRQEMKSTGNARDHAENMLSELQSEVAVLRTQNEHLNADKKKMMQDLIDAKNEIQMLSQRKLEVEHNLRTSQFRENEATVFLRQFRRFYRRLLRNKAAQGTGDTSEITAKVPGVPDLHDLIDVDTLLLESGLIEEEELHDDTSVGTYRPSSAALLRSTSAAKKAAKEASALAKAAGIDGDEDASLFSAGSVGSSIRRRPMGSLTVAAGAESLDVISEIGDGGVSQAAWSATDGGGESRDGGESQQQGGDGMSMDQRGRADDVSSIGARRQDAYPPADASAVEAPRNGGGGADAGAGSVYNESDFGTESSAVSATSDVISESDIASSVSAGSSSYTASIITRRQKLLRTPSGRLTTMREKDLERDLLQMTERCIELQIALNEEKANVDVLTNRSGSLSKKRLAQEAISLRQALDRKTHDLQAIIWKMNELHLINKTYNEKMANREQHVTYLEENLVDLQNTNRRLIEERQESEKKLRDELENLRVMVDAMTIPLWQFGEGGVTGRTLASRVMLPIRGGEHDRDADWDDPHGLRGGPRDIDGDGASMSGSSYAPEDGEDEEERSARSALPSGEPTEDRSAAVATAAGAAAGAAVLAQEPRRKVETSECSTQTEEVKVMTAGTMTEEQAEAAGLSSVESVDVGTMTEEEEKPTPKDVVDTVDMGTMTEEEEAPLLALSKGDAVDVGTMTEESEMTSAAAAAAAVASVDAGTMTDKEASPTSADAGTMTDPTPVEPEAAARPPPSATIGTMTEEQRLSSPEGEASSSPSSGKDMGTQTDPPPPQQTVVAAAAAPDGGARGMPPQTNGVATASSKAKGGREDGEEGDGDSSSDGGTMRAARAAAAGATVGAATAATVSAVRDDDNGDNNVAVVTRAAAPEASENGGAYRDRQQQQQAAAAAASSAPSSWRRRDGGKRLEDKSRGDREEEEAAAAAVVSAAAVGGSSAAAARGGTGDSDMPMDDEAGQLRRQPAERSSAPPQPEPQSKRASAGGGGSRQREEEDNKGAGGGRAARSSTAAAAQAAAAENDLPDNTAASRGAAQYGSRGAPPAPRDAAKEDNEVPIEQQQVERGATTAAAAAAVAATSANNNNRRELADEQHSATSASASTAPMPRDIEFQPKQTTTADDEYRNSRDRDRGGRKSLSVQESSPGQLPDTMFPGGKQPTFRPRRFAKKMGPSVKPGVLKESKKKNSGGGGGGGSDRSGTHGGKDIGSSAASRGRSSMRSSSIGGSGSGGGGTGRMRMSRVGGGDM